MSVSEKLKNLPFVRFLYEMPGVASLYHFLLAFLGAFLYGFPSRKLYVIGVTGTKGKTTACDLIAQILTAAGFRTGLATTVSFRVGEKEWVNDTKQTMLGRFQLQKLLRDMVRNGCRYAVIETSSEGIAQHRHRFIDYRMAVFTNLSPEHIERHGSFEAYRLAKVKLFEAVARRSDGIGIYNLDDPNVAHFLAPRVPVKYGYTLHAARGSTADMCSRVFSVTNVRLSPELTTFQGDGERFETPLVGEFNVYNAVAAIVAAESQGIVGPKVREALRRAKPPRGRMELIRHHGVTIVIDYAHEPASLEAVYRALTILRPRKIIGLLGAQGGGRDRWKRPRMGEIASRYCDALVVTTEDPYNENPWDIINDVARGVARTGDAPAAQIYKILDRREAIVRAVSLAKKGDVVVLTGKGGEVWMCIAAGRKIPWDERRVVEEILEGVPKKK